VADLISKLDEITDLVESAKSMPLSASCVVNRAELLAALDEVRDLLPRQLADATDIVADRDELVEQARREAERVVEAAHAERARLLAQSELAQQADLEAERIVAEAREEAARMRQEVDDYVDAKLANFEVVLNKTLSAVERGRDKLRGRRELEELAGAEALPR
jgi:cell division septum initiation protein DivIVA